MAWVKKKLWEICASTGPWPRLLLLLLFLLLLLLLLLLFLALLLLLLLVGWRSPSGLAT